MRIELERRDQMPFWFPILLPVLMGLLVAFADLTVDMARTSASDGASWWDFVMRDLTRLWSGTSKGVASSIFALDIWALTMLYTNRHETDTSSNYAYAYPVLGIFAHFVLLLLVVALNALAGGADADAFLEDDPDSYKSRAIAMRSFATVSALAAVAVAWAVRRGVWIHYESGRLS